MRPNKVASVCIRCGSQFTDHPSAKRKYCSAYCASTARRENRATIFWAKATKSEDGCWLWRGGQFPGRYGQFAGDGAHRIAYELTYGPITKGFVVAHHCDVPSCVRPDHLFLGTYKDNSEDMVRKGRSVKGDKHGLRKHPELILRGDRSPHHKLTGENVRHIREQRERGETFTAIAQRMGVTRGCVADVVKGLTWTHVE